MTLTETLYTRHLLFNTTESITAEHDQRLFLEILTFIITQNNIIIICELIDIH